MPSIKVIRLPRLTFNWRDQPELLERYWDEAMTTIEKAVNDLRAIPVIQEGLANLDTAVAKAQQAAETATSAAADASGQASAQDKEASLVNSYISGSPLSAASTGVVTVNDHKRVYGNPSLDPSVDVKGGSVTTGASPGDTVRLYYIDATRSGGTVSYLFKTEPDLPPAQGHDVHSVGAVLIPDTGTKPGKVIRQPGYVEP